MLLTYILFYHYGLTIYILDLSIYYKFKMIILFFLKKKKEINGCIAICKFSSNILLILIVSVIILKVPNRIFLLLSF